MSLGHTIAPFDNGFEIRRGHPLVPALFQVGRTEAAAENVTVHATPELHWKVVEVSRGSRIVSVRCEPWIEQLRDRLRSDHWYLNNVITTNGYGL